MQDNLPAVLLPNTEKATWNLRREQLIELFEKNVFGVTPKGDFQTSAKLLYQNTALQGKARREYYQIEVQSGPKKATFHMCLILPYTQTKAPVVLMISNHDKCAVPLQMPAPAVLKNLMDQAPAEWVQQAMAAAKSVSAGEKPGQNLLDIENDERKEYWPVDKIIASGRAAAAFYASEVQADDRTQFPSLFAALFTQESTVPKGERWGTLGIWAFAASRVIDVLCTHDAIDKNRIALAGHSRGAKAALWCAAQDTRIKSVLVNNSGCTGAAVSRGKKGENVASITAMFPHWFCENYAQYAWKENEMPFDQHMLVAALAPRICYVTSGTQDNWSDPEAEWRGVKAASVAWQLYTAQVLPEQPPEAGQQVCVGNLAYHRRAGKHDLTGWDWERFLAFLDTHSA